MIQKQRWSLRRLSQSMCYGTETRFEKEVYLRSKKWQVRNCSPYSPINEKKRMKVKREIWISGKKRFIAREYLAPASLFWSAMISKLYCYSSTVYNAIMFMICSYQSKVLFWLRTSHTQQAIKVSLSKVRKFSVAYRH